MSMVVVLYMRWSIYSSTWWCSYGAPQGDRAATLAAMAAVSALPLPLPSSAPTSVNCKHEHVNTRQTGVWQRWGLEDARWQANRRDAMSKPFTWRYVCGPMTRCATHKVSKKNSESTEYVIITKYSLEIKVAQYYDSQIKALETQLWPGSPILDSGLKGPGRDGDVFPF